MKRNRSSKAEKRWRRLQRSSGTGRIDPALYSIRYEPNPNEANSDITISHITLNTGHVRKFPASCIHNTVCDCFEKIVTTGQGTIPIMPAYSLDLTADFGDTYAFTICDASVGPLVYCSYCISSECSGNTWDQLMRAYGQFGEDAEDGDCFPPLPDWVSPPDAPWLATILYPTIAICNSDNIQRFAAIEAGVAETWRRRVFQRR